MPTKPGHITTERARELAGMRKKIGKTTGRGKVMRPCPRCGQLCGARELKYEHPAVCVELTAE